MVMRRYKPLSNEYYERLGHIAELFASVESHMQMWIHFLATPERQPSDQRTVLLVASEDFKILLAKLDRLFAYCVDDPTLLLKYEKLSIRLNRLNKRRNDFIHADSWTTAHPTDIVLRSKRGRSPSPYGDMLHPQRTSLRDFDDLVNSTDKLFYQEMWPLLKSVCNNRKEIDRVIAHRKELAKKKKDAELRRIEKLRAPR